jgi:hypothetical protein
MNLLAGAEVDIGSMGPGGPRIGTHEDELIENQEE